MLVDRCNEGRDIYAVLLKLQLRVARYELRGEPRQSKRDGYVHLRPRLVLPVDLVDPDADRAGGGRPWARPGGARTDLAGRQVWALRSEERRVGKGGRTATEQYQSSN